VRGEILMPIADLARELKVCMVTIGHLRKNGHGYKDDPLQAMMGAGAFTGVARSVWAFGKDPDEDSPYAHIMTPCRGAVAEGGYKYQTEEETLVINGVRSKVVKVVWDGKTTATAEQAVNAQSEEEKTAEKEAADLIHDFLQHGRRAAEDCQEHLRKQLGED